MLCDSRKLLAWQEDRRKEQRVLFPSCILALKADFWIGPVFYLHIDSADNFKKNDYVIHYPQGSGNSSILQENGGKQERGHSHQFEWKTITTPTAEADGLEAYACHLQFEYLHKQYEVLIPAKMPMDTECEWYGPLKLCNLYPYTIK